MESDAAQVSVKKSSKSIRSDGNFNSSSDDHDSSSSKSFNVYDQENYKMNHTNRGIALVINMFKFKDDKPKTRHGSEEDAKSLRDVLEKKLGFTVLPHEDLTRTELSAKLDEVLQMDHSDNDCLLVAIMSHGTENGYIWAHDGVIELREIWDKFRGHKSLMGKPKLFFVQACRGLKVAKGSEIPNQLVPDAQSNTVSIPEFADNLVMYSTDEGTISIREHQTGTWFIQELGQQLKTNSSSDLLSILTVVSRKVALKNGVIEVNGEHVPAKQLPIIVSSLTKKIYFHGQNIANDSCEKQSSPTTEEKVEPGRLTKLLPFAFFAGFTVFSLIRN